MVGPRLQFGTMRSARETPRRDRTGRRPHEGRTPDGRNYLAHEQGDANNAILAAAGYNFLLLLNWLRQLFRLLLAELQIRPISIAARIRSLFTVDQLT